MLINRKRLALKTLLVAATHRSGSYLACDWVSSTGDLPFPEEHFNYDLKTAREELQLSELVHSNKVLESLIDRRISTHGIFTVKAMWPAFATLFYKLSETKSGRKPLGTTALHWLESPKILFIRRRDKFRQAVSFEIAKQSGVWRRQRGEEPGKSDFLYSYPRILACWNQIHEDEAGWLHFFKACGLAYHEIWYEDIISEPSKEIELALKYIGVEPQLKMLPRSRFVKQSDARNCEWAQRFKSRHSMGEEEELLTSAKKRPKDQSKGSSSAIYNSFLISICPQISKIEIEPDSTRLITVKIKNEGAFPWHPILNAHDLSDYFLELRDSRASKKEFLWQSELEEVVQPGESVELTLRLKSDTSLSSFDCDLLFTYPEGELVVSKALSVDIQLDEKWEVLRKIFHRIDTSEKSGWVYIKDFGDMWIEKFPFVYLHEQGWLCVHKESSSPGTLCVIDFELSYFVVHLNRPREFHVFSKYATSAKQLEFLEVEKGMRKFKDLQSGEIQTYPLSYQSDLEDPNFNLKNSN